jgi:hypothetical protein
VGGAGGTGEVEHPTWRLTESVLAVSGGCLESLTQSEKKYFVSDPRPKCDVCGDRHYAHQAHVFASNTASNGMVNASNQHLTDENQKTERRGIQEDSNAGGCVAVGSNHAGVGVADGHSNAVAVLGTKQRWSRDAYNAYQREYMRKRRGKRPDAVGSHTK